MYCRMCGKENRESAKFCTECGADLTAVYEKKTTTTRSAVTSTANIIDANNRFAWALATVPITVSWMITWPAVWLFGFNASVAIYVVTLVLNITFFALDIKTLEKNGWQPDKWLWLGIVLVPLYLFMRASKTDRNYWYGAAWCILWFIDMVII